jgi:hypothetical protein
MCSAARHVRFIPNSDRKSGFPHKVVSALAPKADICGAKRNVRFGPKAVMGNDHERSGSNAATRGKITLISVNSPGCVSTSIDPPCCFTMMS